MAWSVESDISCPETFSIGARKESKRQSVSSIRHAFSCFRNRGAVYLLLALISSQQATYAEYTSVLRYFPSASPQAPKLNLEQVQEWFNVRLIPLECILVSWAARTYDEDGNLRSRSIVNSTLRSHYDDETARTNVCVDCQGVRIFHIKSCMYW